MKVLQNALELGRSIRVTGTTGAANEQRPVAFRQQRTASPERLIVRMCDQHSH
jgi:hypothetical protein